MIRQGTLRNSTCHATPAFSLIGNLRIFVTEGCMDDTNSILHAISTQHVETSCDVGTQKHLTCHKLRQQNSRSLLELSIQNSIPARTSQLQLTESPNHSGLTYALEKGRRRRQTPCLTQQRY
ncbi:hypothetical protein SCLCIDRAFT_334179 [Scleroderma citrinum Foug A]|uniref:Uncharacterized protein n=1 Tax=Scleroderma citrinum Foug A TaxID=1036808 RepID=A0A0C3DEW0_9AGAM|nr:hypothetical protein SCLCIDRAFT_334179 [Scleroderma citrinum Foug A]